MAWLSAGRSAWPRHQGCDHRTREGARGSRRETTAAGVDAAGDRVEAAHGGARGGEAEQDLMEELGREEEQRA